LSQIRITKANLKLI